MSKDPNFIAALERAISEKYGEVAIKHPKCEWSEEKEKKYLEELKQQIKVQSELDKEQNQIDLNGILLTKKLISSNINRSCQSCKIYSFNRNDDLFLNKFQTCYKCYIKHIEGREERWNQGWRPKEMEQK